MYSGFHSNRNNLIQKVDKKFIKSLFTQNQIDLILNTNKTQSFTVYKTGEVGLFEQSSGMCYECEISFKIDKVFTRKLIIYMEDLK